ncbi:MAG: exopolysaccharide biosynthesis polyprenyl glycosylphosphotransferase, partial [Actinomycetota bacterium]
MQKAIDVEAAKPLNVSAEAVLHAGELLGRRTALNRRRLVVLALVFSDVLLAVLVWEMAVVVQSIWGRGALSDVAVATVASNVAVWVGLRGLLGLYPGYGLDQVEELRRQTHAVIASAAITAIFSIFFQVGDLLSRLLLISGFLGLAVMGPLMRHFAKQAMIRAGLWGKPVVVLSFGEAGRRLVRLLKKERGLGLRPVAIFDSRMAPVKGQIEGVPYGGSVSEAMGIRWKGVDTAIFAMPHTRREHLVGFARRARESFRHIIVIPNLDGVTNSAVVARNLAGTFGVEVRHNLLDPWTRRAKRALDLGAVLVGGWLVLPLIVILALLIRLESGGPVFYRAERMGRDNRLFACVKFRTMVTGAEEILQRMLAENEELRKEYSRYHKLRDDPRVTRVGRFLRKTSLDELPQLWNVLKGEMSLVGPRPYLPRESADIGDTQSDILRVYPGITGPWQVNG